jgi:hypothetical protein
MSDGDPQSLTAENAKLVTLARGAMGRAGARQGAAVRDADGRTYAAATVALPSLRLTALQAAVAIAVASGADGLEAVVVVGGSDIDDVSLAAATDLGAGLLVTTDAAGVVLGQVAL